MNELITLQSCKLAGKAIKAVSARELHSYLEVGRKFYGWISARIAKYEFQESLDYVKSQPQTGPNLIGSEVDYFLSVDMAKELCMLERNEKGRLARKYFIEVEKKFRALSENSQANPIWLNARRESKVVRRILTDLIQDLAQYATSQGSTNAEMLFVVYSKLVNSELLEIDGPKPKNLRDQLNVTQLQFVAVAEHLIAKTVVESMRQNLPYKDIYRLAKAKVAAFASTVGKSKLGQTERQTLGLPA